MRSKVSRTRRDVGAGPGHDVEAGAAQVGLQGFVQLLGQTTRVAPRASETRPLSLSAMASSMTPKAIA